MISTINISASFHGHLFSKIDFSKAGYSVLVRNGQPLLLLPPERRAAALTLGLYLPQGRKAKLAANVLEIANSLGLLQRILPKLVSEHTRRQEIEAAGKKPATTKTQHSHQVTPVCRAGTGRCVSWLDSSAQSETLPFCQDDIDRGRVGFLLCNPDHECARVVAIKAGNPVCVIKWCDLSGEAKLNREIENINALTAKNLPCVAALLSCGRNSGSCWFEMEHYAKADIVSVCDPRAVKLLASWMSAETIAPLDNELVASLWTTEEWTPGQSARERLAELKIRKAVVHGDFAAWNLRAGQDGLVSIDWEWAEPDGIAGLDLCYGLLQEALLVKKLPPRQALHYIQVAADSPDCKEYLKAAGWHGALDLWIKTGVFYRHSRKPCPDFWRFSVACRISTATPTRRAQRDVWDG